MKILYVANWKMNLSFTQSISFCKTHYNELKQLSHNADIVLCPSFITLAPITEMCKNSTIAIGAQNCSNQKSGAYTGEISAESLAEINIKYCIVGHSERTKYYGETTQQIIQKIELLYENNITPIICIAETKQLKPILKAIAQQKQNNNHVIIAYEPVESIGTGIIPNQEHLTAVFTHITELIHAQLPHHTFQLLYGGSVDQNNIIELKKAPLINGFLIGGASIDFAKLQAIILSE